MHLSSRPDAIYTSLCRLRRLTNECRLEGDKSFIKHMKFSTKWGEGTFPITPFTLALLIRSETGFAPLRAFTLHQLIRINNLIRIKLNHLLEVVSHRFSLLRDQITSVDANRTRTKEEQIEINARGYIWPIPLWRALHLHTFLNFVLIPQLTTIMKQCNNVLFYMTTQ